MSKKNIMFLCTGNSCRSQMAEGWARKYWGDEFDIYSAGTKKHGMNQRAMKVMKEVGVDLSSHYSKTTEELPPVTFDYVVTVCDAAQENCPYFPSGKIVHVGFQDPPALTKEMSSEEEILAVYRRVRDEIELFVKNMKNVLEQ
jgi:arsenate reductase (thioredoxin)